MAALQAGAEVLAVSINPEGGHTHADLSALDWVDQAAFDIAGALAEVIAGIGNPALESLDLAGLADDGVWCAYTLGCSGATIAAVLARADQLLRATPGALADLAGHLAERRELDRLTLAWWWSRLPLDSALTRANNDSRPQASARVVAQRRSSTEIGG